MIGTFDSNYDTAALMNQDKVQMVNQKQSNNMKKLLVMRTVYLQDHAKSRQKQRMYSTDRCLLIFTVFFISGFPFSQPGTQVPVKPVPARV